MQPSLVIHSFFFSGTWGVFFFPALSSWAKCLRFVPLPVKYALPMEDVVHFLKARMLQLGSFVAQTLLLVVGNYRLYLEMKQG